MLRTLMCCAVGVLFGVGGLRADPPKQVKAEPVLTVTITGEDGKSHTYPLSVGIKIISGDGFDFGRGRRSLTEVLQSELKADTPVTMRVEKRYGTEVVTKIQLGKDPSPLPWTAIKGKVSKVEVGK